MREEVRKAAGLKSYNHDKHLYDNRNILTSYAVYDLSPDLSLWWYIRFLL